MAFSDVGRFQLRRVNAFHGLMIDSAVWQDAHEYHRNQMRLHQLALHGWGIVSGLEACVAGPDNTLSIQPGIAVDPAGSYIVVAEPHIYQIEARKAGTLYLLMQFAEIPSGPAQPMIDGLGQPTRILEAYRIQQRDEMPSEPCLELARVQYDPSRGPIVSPRDPDKPGINELDLRFRVSLGTAAAHVVLPALAPATMPSVAPIEAPAPTLPPVSAPPPPIDPTPAVSTDPLSLAIAAHGGPGWDCHNDGLRFLAREVQATAGYPIRLLDHVSPAEVDGVDLLYLTGHGRLSLRDDSIAGLARVMERGGVVIAEGCAAGPDGETGAREFARSYAEVALRINRQLARVERGHPLLVARHVFAIPPAGGVDNSMLLEAGGMVYSYADYGCAWQGGPSERPLPRGTIRDALELGVNLVLYRRPGD